MSESDIAVRAHAAAERAGNIDPSSVTGWAVDADPRNDPTYPYRDRSADDGLRLDWKRPPQQRSDVEVLRSVEYEHSPAVFGTSVPPKWVSGMVRRAAFRWSESHWAHWLLLLGADRVNMVEGLIEDVTRGKLPNIPREMGVPAEWRHNKKGLAAKVGIAAAIGGALYVFSRWRSARSSGSPVRSRRRAS